MVYTTGYRQAGHGIGIAISDCVDCYLKSFTAGPREAKQLVQGHTTQQCQSQET